MRVVENQTMDSERALYGSCGIMVRNCKFDGPADGESALKESSDVVVEDSYFNLRYPFWHVHGLTIRNSEMTDKCRASMWYSDHIDISGSKLHGIKALRECSKVTITSSGIISPEFGWSVHGLKSVLNTKDAFWHAKNVTVRDSVVNGEYLAWYSENLTFINCTIKGTQPLCYCKGLKLINCEMIDCDLAFERSEVEAEITTPVISIKNPLSGRITVPDVGEIIRDIPGADGEVVITD